MEQRARDPDIASLIIELTRRRRVPRRDPAPDLSSEYDQAHMGEMWAESTRTNIEDRWGAANRREVRGAIAPRNFRQRAS